MPKLGGDLLPVVSVERAAVLVEDHREHDAAVGDVVMECAPLVSGEGRHHLEPRIPRFVTASCATLAA